MTGFNIRVYGIYINENLEVLVSDEEAYGQRFTKFPGGGVELGEGLYEALHREFLEECSCQILIEKHIYTTDFFIKSAFHNQQLISIYYLVKPIQTAEICISQKAFDFSDNVKQSFRFIPLQNLSKSDFTFEIDKHVVDLLKTNDERNSR